MPRARDVLGALGFPFVEQDGLSKVTLVGAGMHGVPGVMARLVGYLDIRKVPVYQTADSHTTISVLVKSENAASAVQALHDGFELGDHAGETSVGRDDSGVR